MFADPVKILRDFGIGSGMIVADLGAGSGFYSIAAARMVSEGKVYAVEVQKDFLTTIKIKIEKEHIKNIEYVWGDIEKIGGTKLADGLCDVVILSNVLFSVQDKKKTIEEAKRILKKGGRILFIDWNEESALGPRSNFLLKKEDLKSILLDTGLSFDRDISAGEHHYGMIYRKI